MEILEEIKKEAIPSEVLAMFATAYAKHPEEVTEFLKKYNKNEPHNPELILGNISHWNNKFAVTNREIFSKLCAFVGNDLKLIQKYYGKDYVKGSFEEFSHLSSTISVKEVVPGIWLNQKMGVPKMITQLIKFANHLGISLVEVE